MKTIFVKSPVGNVGATGAAKGVVGIVFGGQGGQNGLSGQRGEKKILAACAKQLKEYFAGTRKKFTVSLVLEGTPFQKRVWSELQKIPFGQTASYGEIARRIGKPKAARAVGGACNKNKIPIIIPCHRVIGSNGKLVGFAGGLSLKKRLLAFEQGVLAH